jgi:hypothetical protein
MRQQHAPWSNESQHVRKSPSQTAPQISPYLVSAADHFSKLILSHKNVWIRTGAKSRIQLNPEEQIPIPATGCLCFELRTGFRNHLRQVTRI